MSNALAISAVSAVLQYMLNSVLNASGLGSVTVLAIAPDLAQSAIRSGQDANPTLNLFLHQVTLNAAWRNVGLPSLAADGATQLKNPPLALDLHYLLTAYAGVNFQAEALLGFAIQMLHASPVLPRGQVSSILTKIHNDNTSDPLLGGLQSSGLASQIEMIKITPATLGREEMAWLWTALKADYRPTFPFQVSVVLIESPAPLLAGMPVLTRSITVQPSLLPGFPTLNAANPPANQPVACLGDTVTVTGSGLSQVTEVVLANTRMQVQQNINALTDKSDVSFSFVLAESAPSGGNPTDLPAGFYQLTAQVSVTTSAGTSTVNTNTVPLAIAPKIGSTWAPGTLSSGESVTLTVPCTPYLRAGQQVALLIGGQSIPASAFVDSSGNSLAFTNTPSFTSTGLQPTGGPVPAWLQVDGIDSPIVNMTATPPVYSAAMVKVS